MKEAFISIIFSMFLFIIYTIIDLLFDDASKHLFNSVLAIMFGVMVYIFLRTGKIEEDDEDE